MTPMGMPLKLWGADAIQKQELVVDEERLHGQRANPQTATRTRNHSESATNPAGI